ncbi:hypothetical protein OS493_019298 [Desmophyllum pertusum]|uniref:Uncharacterized protein n=1 Tax=Desmophyllum pertusum TaxID=174260 RepID=A0A9X0CE63_9CNID|nr:hypothetical protein OS493_019298 [Desmophyllum pertusum]
MDVGVVGSGAGGGCLAVVDGDGSSPSLITASSEVELFSPFRKGVVPKAKGIYLAFLDQGVCMAIQKVVISYRFCSERGSTLVRFPRTVAPANDSDLIEQAGECTDKNSVNKVKLSGVCLSNGEWNISDALKCLCNTGYELIMDLWLHWNAKNVQVVLTSIPSAIPNVFNVLQTQLLIRRETDCTCDKGFYESTDLGDCKALPYAPLNENATIVKATYVVISWHRSPDDNGMLRYAVDCFRCKYKKSQELQGVVWPTSAIFSKER